jgi:LysM repeat protein
VIGDITMAKHRAPRYVRTKKVIARAPVAAGATVVGLGVLSSPAHASTTHDWTGVAQCESGGDWSTNTGNGYFGGLQFSRATWAGFGGTAFAPSADQATPAQQVEIAEKVLAGQGIGAWPTCGSQLADGATAVAEMPAPAPAPAPAAKKPAPAPAPAGQSSAAPATAPDDDAQSHGRHAAPEDDYTVARGNTLTQIAAAHSQPWRDLYQRNVDVVGGNPDLIFPGQVLTMAGARQATPAAPPAAGAPAAPAAAPAPAPAAEPSPAPAPTPAPAPAPAPSAAAAPAAAPAPAARAHIVNSAGSVKPQVQVAANRVVTEVSGAAGITLGGTRASAVDPHGHPSGLALDYMVMSDAALGDAIAQYHIAHWDELGVEYVIWQQKILTSPTGSWKQMEDRGSATANHYDHVHVNYRG